MVEYETIMLEVTVLNRVGLHIRPAAELAKMAKCFSSSISIEHTGTVCDGKSALAVLMLGAAQGARLTVSAKGKDAAEAVEAIAEQFARKFGAEDSS